jgi:tellurite resistance protein TerC
VAKKPFINGGHQGDVPEILTLFSLGIVVLTLIVTTIARVTKTRAASSPRH